MGRKLTNRERDSRIIQRVIRRIKTIEKEYGIYTTKRACQRYALQRNAESKLEREIKQREEELKELKQKTLNSSRP